MSEDVVMKGVEETPPPPEYELTFIEDQNNRNQEKYLYLFEPYSINYYNYNTHYWSNYKGIITWNRKIYDEHKSTFNMILLDTYPEIFKIEQKEFVPFHEKIDGVCLITKLIGPHSKHTNIHAKRIEVANEFFQRGVTTHVYGNMCSLDAGLQEPSMYRGCIGKKSETGTYIDRTKTKVKQLSKYKFCICFENCYDEYYSWDYLTEKIFDCFAAGVIPIYFGCYNVESIIPRDLFIDFRYYKTFDAMFKYIKNIGSYEKAFNNQIEKAWTFYQTKNFDGWKQTFKNLHIKGY